MIVGTAAMARDQHAFSASALFSEHLRGARSVKTDIIASLILHAYIEEITAQELYLSCLIVCVLFDFIRQRLNTIINEDFCADYLLGRETIRQNRVFFCK